MRVRESSDFIDQRIDLRQQDLATAFAQHERMREVVNVFRCTGEMDELADLRQFLVTGNFFLEEVLDRLDVVVGRALDIFDAARIVFAETLDDTVEHRIGMGAEWWHFLDFGVRGKRLQPPDLYQHTVSDQAELTEDGP